MGTNPGYIKIDITSGLGSLLKVHTKYTMQLINAANTSVSSQAWRDRKG